MADLPPLSALPAFEAVARLGAMTAAAAELGRTHSAVSKQIAHLEAALGVALFRRGPRGLTLTREGAAYAAVVADALEDIRRATRRARRGGGGRALTVRLSGALAARWLIPRLPDFQARRPAIAVDLSVAIDPSPAPGGGDIALEAGGFDMLLSWDRLTTPRAALRRAAGAEAEIRPLGDAAYGPVAAPGVMAVGDDDGALRGPVIRHAALPDLWAPWEALSGARVVETESRRFPNTSLCIEAGLAGMGAVLVERRLVADDLTAGRLVAPLGFHVEPDGFLAVLPRPAPGADVFLDWLAAQA